MGAMCTATALGLHARILQHGGAHHAADEMKRLAPACLTDAWIIKHVRRRLPAWLMTNQCLWRRA
jgi:hypothetical protein